MDRRSTKSLWRDYGVPMQDPKAFSLQYGKDTTHDPSKPIKKKPTKKVDYTDHTGLLKIQKPKKAQEGLKASLYNKYPALKSMGEVTLKPDTAFTRDKTGAGSIEYFSPTQDTITYDNGYKYPHPGLGTHGIVYNPQSNTEQDVALDMLHGMSAADKTYAKRRNSFGESFMDSKFSSDLNREWERYNEETEGKNDGYEQFKKNYLDGTVRNLMFEGTPEDFKKSNYWEDARKVYLSDPKINKNFSRLQSYITTGKKMKGLFKNGGKVGDPKNRKKPGGSNVGKYSKAEGPFAGPSGGAPSGSYPIGSKSRGKSALKLAHNAPNPGGIKAAVYRKYPELKTKKAAYGAKLGLLGMGQMQGKAPIPTDRNAPPDKVHTNFKITKRKRKEPKTAFAH